MPFIPNPRLPNQFRIRPLVVIPKMHLCESQALCSFPLLEARVEVLHFDVSAVADDSLYFLTLNLSTPDIGLLYVSVRFFILFLIFNFF